MQADLETLSRHFSMSISILSREALPINPCLDTGEVTLGGEYDVYYIHTDHRGAPVFLTDESAQVVWTTEYDPFGNALCDWGRVYEDATGRTECVPNDEVSGERVEMNLRLPGQYYDEESGLHYNWHRYYDPKIGRYFTPDKVIGSINPYIYALGNPLIYIDPIGMDTEVIIFDPSDDSWLSVIGHVAVRINDNIFSLQPHPVYWEKPHRYNHPYPRPDEYMGDNRHRNATGYILDLPPDDEGRLEECLMGYPAEYNLISGNCGAPIQQCMGEIGRPIGPWSITPAGLGAALQGSGFVTGVNDYPRRTK